MLSKFSKEDEDKINSIKKLSVEISDEIVASDVDKATFNLANKKTLERFHRWGGLLIK
ncbi:MAG: hypothetical protein LBD57_05545 [Endomicrobium sp.]|uniref:hypothetical protein n=1 Tax=Candidatus Endomicrobiellum cubanum TaxID=3242325 RepID=UPI00281E50F7|nr:hypothetical protein [Endomicrobium sp.]